jgi:hypothetical protein
MSRGSTFRLRIIRGFTDRAERAFREMFERLLGLTTRFSGRALRAAGRER